MILNCKKISEFLIRTHWFIFNYMNSIILNFQLGYSNFEELIDFEKVKRFSLLHDLTSSVVHWMKLWEIPGLETNECCSSSPRRQVRLDNKHGFRCHPRVVKFLHRSSKSCRFAIVIATSDMGGSRRVWIREESGAP